MRRRDFFKKIGLGATAAIVAPQLVKAERPWTTSDGSTQPSTSTGAWEQIKEENIHPHHAQYPLTYDESYKPCKISPYDLMEIPSKYTDSNIETLWTVADLEWDNGKRVWVLYNNDDKRTSVTKGCNGKFDFVNIDSEKLEVYSVSGRLSYGQHVYYGHYALFYET